MKNLVIAGLTVMGLAVSSFAANVKWLLVIIPTATSTTAEYQTELYDTEQDANDASAIRANTTYRKATFMTISVDLDKKTEQFEYQLQKVAK